jgi:hypothetical protein
METPLTELCKGLDSCFKEYMDYCKKLEFTEEPNYKYMIGLFETSMKTNNLDPKVFDYTWKEDRLKREKKALRQEMELLLKKKPAPKKEE